MARHIDTITTTRDGLLHRYANAMGCTYAQAVDVNQSYTLDQLRDRVENVEFFSASTVLQGGARRSFARSLPTTSVQGQTR